MMTLLGVAALSASVAGGTVEPSPSCEHLPPTPADAPRAAWNDNREPAGELRDGVPTVRLVMTTTVWHPDGPDGCGIAVTAFAEEGAGPTVPGPLLRVPEGTQLHVSVRNHLSRPLWLKGLEDRPADALTAVRLDPGASREFRFRASPPPVGLRAGTAYRFRFIGIYASDVYGLWLEKGARRDGVEVPGLRYTPNSSERGIRTPGTTSSGSSSSSRFRIRISSRDR